jgi:hypothetical protein
MSGKSGVFYFIDQRSDCDRRHSLKLFSYVRYLYELIGSNSAYAVGLNQDVACPRAIGFGVSAPSSSTMRLFT